MGSNKNGYWSKINTICVNNLKDIFNNIIKPLTQYKNQRRYFKSSLFLNKYNASLSY